MVYFERENGERVAFDNVTENMVDILLRSGRFRTVMRTKGVTVLRKAGRHVGKATRAYKYGGSDRMRNPYDYIRG